MSIDWEATFRSWSKPSSDSEKERSDNAESMIRKAIAESTNLSARNVQVFAQGSYRNNTNVRADSDVDICVRCMDVFFYDFSMVPGTTLSDVGAVAPPVHFPEFRREVGNALVAKFGAEGVTRGQKAFDVHPNTYRVDADVVATFESRLYYRNIFGNLEYLSGTEFVSDTGTRIRNWPQQHYENGVEKNKATGNRFKFITRALKRLRNKMVSDGIKAALPVPSYLIECLVFNSTDECFEDELYATNVKRVLMFLLNNLQYEVLCSQWLEVNRIKHLFQVSQPWTRAGFKTSSDVILRPVLS